MSIFTKANGRFFLDGQEFQLLSGAIHYFRVPRAYWVDRLEKLIALGCNTVETYVPWNLHEPRPGQFCFEGNLDLEAFLTLAHERGLKALIRPSPYICGEFEFGGQPWWLLKDPQLRVRTLCPTYTEAVTRYYAQLLPRLARLQCTQGGPILACQIENEYGYFGNNLPYLTFLRDLLVRQGIDVLLFTTDGPWGQALEAGSLPGVLAGGSFGSGAPAHFDRMQALRPDDPLVCSEFWMGWFDAWGDEHHTRDPLDAARSLEEILQRGHVNLYMFHGGTNFGFTAGANHYDELKPDVTSYDYDAPLNEAGDPTPKYHAFREVIGRYVRDPRVKERLARPWDAQGFSTPIRKTALGEAQVAQSVSLARQLGPVFPGQRADRPLAMEELDQGYGYVLYRIELPGPGVLDRFVLWKCHDRAVVSVNGFPVAAQTGNEVGQPLVLDLPLAHNLVEVLVENQGRVNFGEKMDDQRKGLLGAILVDKHAHNDVETFGLGLDDLSGLRWDGNWVSGTAGFHRIPFSGPADDGQFHDTFLELEGWGKGVAWVNGFNLGRFWDRGPQRTLYVPGPLVRPGANELIVFETEGRAPGRVRFLDHPRLS